MKAITKTITAITILILLIAIEYWLVPMNAWKTYKENHPVLFSADKESVPTYRQFCKSYWKAFVQTNKDKEDKITYDGGELNEITVMP